MSHHHVEHVPGFGLDVAADRHVLPVGQHHGHLPLGRTGAALFGLGRAHRTQNATRAHEEHTHVHVHMAACAYSVHASVRTDIQDAKSDSLESETKKSALECIEIDFQTDWIKNKEKPTTMDPGSSRTT